MSILHGACRRGIEPRHTKKGGSNDDEKAAVPVLCLDRWSTFLRAPAFSRFFSAAAAEAVVTVVFDLKCQKARTGGNIGLRAPATNR